LLALTARADERAAVADAMASAWAAAGVEADAEPIEVAERGATVEA